MLFRQLPAIQTNVTIHNERTDFFMPKIAVLIPCYNEAQTIGKVISDYHQALPEADIYVYDNNSTDATARLATTGGQLYATNINKVREM